MIDLVRELGDKWAHLLLANPGWTGLAFLVFGVGWIFQQTTKVMYPDYATRPTWARWFVAIGDVMTTDIANLVRKRLPTREVK